MSRASTSLELFFDLCFVVAVAQASSGLHHDLSEGHVTDGVSGYLFIFFAVWWAWMNFTWFASAYDTDDVAYRLTTLVQMAGALVFAAGVPRAFVGGDFVVITLGYVIMRLAMVTQWLRAARADPTHRRGCLRFAFGVTLVQIGWVVRLALPQPWDMVAFGVLVVAELAVPIWAEQGARTTWHPEHIAERYGLFTLIVLGESVLAATVAIQSELDTKVAVADLASTAVGGMLTVFSMWWLYFTKDAARFLTSLKIGFIWGYGHYLIFGSAAAVGAGLGVNVDHAMGRAHLGSTAAAASFTVPAAVFVTAVWVLHWLPQHILGWHNALAPMFAAAILLSTFTAQAVLVTGLLMAALVFAGILAVREPGPTARPRRSARQVAQWRGPCTTRRRTGCGQWIYASGEGPLPTTHDFRERGPRRSSAPASRHAGPGADRSRMQVGSGLAERGELIAEVPVERCEPTGKGDQCVLSDEDRAAPDAWRHEPRAGNRRDRRLHSPPR